MIYLTFVFIIINKERQTREDILTELSKVGYALTYPTFDVDGFNSYSVLKKFNYYKVNIYYGKFVILI